MNARVRTIQPATGELATAIRNIRETELPALEQTSGFAGLLLLASLSDSAAGERLESISLWEDASALAAFDRRSRDREAQLIAASGVGAHTYDVPLSAGMPGGLVARYISARLNPGQIDTVIGLFENVVMHAATSQQGFRRGLLLVDRAENRAISVGLWQSEAALVESERVGYFSQQIDNFSQIVAGPIMPEILSVVLER